MYMKFEIVIFQLLFQTLSILLFFIFMFFIINHLNNLLKTLIINIIVPRKIEKYAKKHFFRGGKFKGLKPS